MIIDWSSSRALIQKLQQQTLARALNRYGLGVVVDLGCGDKPYDRSTAGLPARPAQTSKRLNFKLFINLPKTMTTWSKDYYEKYWRHRLKTEPELTKTIPLRIKLASAYLPRDFPVKILDLGCGEGSFGKLAKKINPQHYLTGIDVSKTCLKLSQPYYDQVLALDLDQPGGAAKLKQKYEVITALEIIEHLANPAQLLEFVKNHLKAEGKLIISFPNTVWWQYRLDLFFKGRFMAEKPTFTSQDHLQFFTLDSIKKLLSQHGFWIETVDGIFSLPWYFGRLPQPLQRCLGKIFPSFFGYQLILVCRKKLKQPVVAHLMSDYLNPSESWLYTQIINQKQFAPIVLSRSLRELKQFPYPAIFKYPLLTDLVLVNQPLALVFLRKILALWQRLKDKVFSGEANYYSRILKASGAKLIHAQYGPSGYQAIKLKQKTNLPLVVSFYGGDAYWLATNFPLWKKRYLQLWSVADAIIVKGPKMKQRLIELGCPAKKIFIIDHGVRLEQIPFRPRCPGKTIKLLTACSLIDYKGVDVAIKALKDLKKNLARINLTIIGDGPERNRLEQLTKKLKLKSQVKFPGMMQFKQLLKTVYDYQIFLHPSFTSADNKQEGIPTSIIERVASGMPVIATDHADIPEIVKDGKNGYLVPEQDVEALAEKIKFLVSRPDLWLKMGKWGRKLVEKNFDATKQTAKREKLYCQLIKARSANI